MKQFDSIQKSILPEPQQKLWPELEQVPKEFNLYGGTAIALYLGHRQSVDFDFFGYEKFDPDLLLQSVSFLKNAVVIQKNDSTLTVQVERGGGIKVSFFGVPEIKRLRQPYIVAENTLRIADILDLAGTKAAVIQKRAEAKDYIDINALMHIGGVSLEMALSAAKAIYGNQFNPEISLKALSYFSDGDLHKLSPEVKKRLVDASIAVNMANISEVCLKQ